jgi:hypothetical protein
MRAFLFEVSGDALLFALPFIGMYLVGFSRLDRLIFAIRNQDRSADCAFEASWLLPEGPSWSGPAARDQARVGR